MKIRPVILCGGSGTRLWPDQKHYQPKEKSLLGEIQKYCKWGTTLREFERDSYDKTRMPIVKHWSGR